MAKYFFIGIGGIGMSALAELLKRQGHEVRGSDVAADSPTVQRLLSQGIAVQEGHALGLPLNAAASFFQPEEIIVLNSAISADNPLWLAAKQQGLKILKRGDLLADFVNHHQGLVVAGSHGKTTTSSMLAHILKCVGKSPSFAIGGRLADSGCNAELGSRSGHDGSGFFVAEGDESDASFLKLFPKVLGITNLDADHMSTYGHSLDIFFQSFVKWIQNLPEDGVAVVNIDNPGMIEVLSQLKKIAPDFWKDKKLIKIGAGVRAKIGHSADMPDILLHSTVQNGQSLQVNFSDTNKDTAYQEQWPLIGEFNAMNALMAGSMAHAIGVSWSEINRALQSYPGVQRRMQFLGKFQEAFFFQDYGHHPTEIRASLLGLKKAYPQARLIQVFQPHRYTRTRDLWHEFIDVLSLADLLILLPIYPASESPISGISSPELLGAMSDKLLKNIKNIKFCEDLSSALSQILANIQPGDVVALQGAGDIPEKLGREIFKDALVDSKDQACIREI
jgi:UDP-N-acetylmuramate--alanine ligase